MNEASLVSEAQEYVKSIFKEIFDGHDYKHSFRVYKNAITIASSIEGCDLLIVSLGALLHDVDDHKLFKTKNNQNARFFLLSHNFNNEQTDRICEVINTVSFSQNRGLVPSTIEGKIVQDADRLDAIGAIGIARTFAYSGAHGKPLIASVNHFHDKLLLLKESMNTNKAKEIAESRHMFLESFLNELNKEIEGLV